MKNVMRLVWVDKTLVEVITGDASGVEAATEFQLQRFVDDDNVLPGDVLMQGVRAIPAECEITHTLTECVQLLMVDRRRTELSDAEGDDD